MKRRQSPVLAGWVVDVGWRADLGRRYHRSGIRPSLSAGAVGPDCEIAIQSYSHAAILCCCCRNTQLLVCHPLQPAEEVDTMSVFGSKARDRWRRWIAIFFRPGVPIGVGGALLGEVFAQSQKQAVPLEGLALPPPEGLEGAPAGGFGRTATSIEQLF